MPGGGRGGAGANILQFYSDDSPGLQVGPTTVLVASLSLSKTSTHKQGFGGKCYAANRARLASSPPITITHTSFIAIEIGRPSAHHK
eukprot:scaffold2780_cov174-Amphora_coffeaeformis.AAC.14